MKRVFIRASIKKKKGEQQGTSKIRFFPSTQFDAEIICMHTLHQFPDWQVLWSTKKKKKKSKGKEEKKEWVKKMKKHDANWHGVWHADLLMLSYGGQFFISLVKK